MIANCQVICCFPGVGKTTLVNNLRQTSLNVTAMDSRAFNKVDFPHNYIADVTAKINDGALVFADSHEDILEGFRQQGIDFVLVYPERDLKEEYLERYRQRGSSPVFVRLMNDRWDNFIDVCAAYSGPHTTSSVLGKGGYLTDALKTLEAVV